MSTFSQGTLAIVDNHAWLMEGTEDGITLAIKPNGITCTLSKFLPQYIAKNIAFFADGFLKKNNLARDDGKGSHHKTPILPHQRLVYYTSCRLLF